MRLPLLQKNKWIVKTRSVSASLKQDRLLAKWSVIVEETRLFFQRLSSNSHPVCGSIAAMTTISLDKPLESFVAKENFKRGADIVVFGDELYRWRNEFNLRPQFIALRDISSGEFVVNNQADLENSDLMPHWAIHWE